VAAETATGTVEIVPDPRHAPGRLVLIGGLESAYVDLRDPTHLRLDYVRRMADALDALVPRGEPVEIVHLGGGGFTLPRHLAAVFGHVAAFGGREVVQRGRAGNLLLLAGEARPALARRLARGPHPSEVVDGRAFAAGARPLYDGAT
jgi:hypothetical protein